MDSPALPIILDSHVVLIASLLTAGCVINSMVIIVTPSQLHPVGPYRMRLWNSLCDSGTLYATLKFCLQHPPPKPIPHKELEGSGKINSGEPFHILMNVSTLRCRHLVWTISPTVSY